MQNRLTFLIVVLLSLSNIAIAQYTEKSPDQGAEEKLPFQNIEALWDVQFNYDATAVTGAAGNAGAIYIPDLNEFWTSRWASNINHRWTSSGTLIEQFTVTGVTGVR
ncbi:MAG: hypothetical protein R6W68_02070, partial [Ignavibacteriaceae bacterium]